MIRRHRLAKRVIVKGKNFWGFPAELIFTPTPNGEQGWFWQPQAEEDCIIPINADCAVSHIRHISLARQGSAGHLSYLYGHEHIGVLRFGGIDGVVVSTRGSFPAPGWPPHFGRACEFWDAVKKYSEPTDGTIPWVTIPETVHGRRSSGRPGYTQLQPAMDGEKRQDNLCLTISVRCEYPNVGRGEVQCRLPPIQGDYDYTKEVALEGLMAVHTQGFPKMLFHLSRLASSLGWPQEHDGVKVIESFLAHRMSDHLGALSLISHTALPALNTISYLSGHEPDLKAVKQARALIGPDPPDKT